MDPAFSFLKKTSFNKDGLNDFNKFMKGLKECSLCELDYYGPKFIEFYLMRSNDEPENELFDGKKFAEYFLEMCSVKDFYVCCDKCDGWELVDQETHDNFKNDDATFNCIKCAVKVPPTISPTNIASKKKAAKSHNRLKKKWKNKS